MREKEKDAGKEGDGSTGCRFPSRFRDRDGRRHEEMQAKGHECEREKGRRREMRAKGERGRCGQRLEEARHREKQEGGGAGSGTIWG